MNSKSHSRYLSELIEATISLTCRNFGFDELRTGQFRGQFIKNMDKVMEITLQLETDGVKKYD